MGSDTFHLRPATSNDRLPIAKLRLSANPNAKSLTREETWFTRWLTRQQEDSRGGCFYVAEVRRIVCGYGMVAWWSPSCVNNAPAHAIAAGYVLMGTWVDPAQRRRGIGTALAQQRLDWIHERASEAWYWTERDNIASERLHAQLGLERFSDDFWFPQTKTDGHRLYRRQWPDVPRRIPKPPHAILSAP